MKTRLIFTIVTTLLMLKLAAQVPLSLQAAIDTALKNNAGIKNQQLNTELQKQLMSTATALPQTGLIAEYGQINSVYADNRFGITQSFSFPAVYAAQKNVLREEWKSALLKKELNELELKKSVSRLYYSLISMKAREELLMKADSLYKEFYIKSDARYKKGETDVLELSAAKSQQAAIHMQLLYLQMDIKQYLYDFNLLLNAKNVYTVENAAVKMEWNGNFSQSAGINHPSLLFLEQQKNRFVAEQRLEKRKLLPELNLGYYNMTMRGNGADNIYYTGASRFQSVQLGLGIPVFYGAQKSRIKAASLNEKIAANAFEAEQNKLQSEYKRLLDTRELLLLSVSYYENEILDNLYLAESAVAARLRTGDVSFLEWVTEVNQLISVRSGYIDAIEKLNNNTIELIYLTQTK